MAGSANVQPLAGKCSRVNLGLRGASRGSCSVKLSDRSQSRAFPLWREWWSTNDGSQPSDGSLTTPSGEGGRGQVKLLTNIVNAGSIFMVKEPGRKGIVRRGPFFGLFHGSLGCARTPYGNKLRLPVVETAVHCSLSGGVQGMGTPQRRWVHFN